MIRVSGSASNDGDYKVKTTGAGSITVDPGVVDESASNTIEIRCV